MNKNSGNDTKDISRRKFLKGAVAGSLGISVLSLPFTSSLSESVSAAEAAGVPRNGLKDLFMKDGKPVVVSIAGGEKIKRLEKGIEALPNFASIMKGKKITLKPNTVAAGPFPVSSDPELIIHLCKILKDCGAADVSIYDASGRTAAKFSMMGLEAAAAKIGFNLAPDEPGNKSLFRAVTNPAWQVMPVIDLSNYLCGRDIIINMPTVKRHTEAAFSSSMKNLFGCVYGPNRYDSHARLRQRQNPQEFEESFRIPFRMLSAEFSDAVRCELSIVDAADLLTKSGPLLDGAEIKKGVNQMFISSDIVACDTLSSKLMAEHDSTYSEDMWKDTLAHARKLGLGTDDLDAMSLVKYNLG